MHSKVSHFHRRLFAGPFGHKALPPACRLLPPHVELVFFRSPRHLRNQYMRPGISGRNIRLRVNDRPATKTGKNAAVQLSHRSGTHD